MPLNILLFKRLFKKHCFVNKYVLRVLIVARIDQIFLQCCPRIPNLSPMWPASQKELPTPALDQLYRLLDPRFRIYDLDPDKNNKS